MVNTLAGDRYCYCTNATEEYSITISHPSDAELVIKLIAWYVYGPIYYVINISLFTCKNFLPVEVFVEKFHECERTFGLGHFGEL